MSAEHDRPIDTRAQAALTELQGMLIQHHPNAMFRLRRDADDPEAL
jgi:hypothetical protein